VKGWLSTMNGSSAHRYKFRSKAAVSEANDLRVGAILGGDAQTLCEELSKYVAKALEHKRPTCSRRHGSWLAYLWLGLDCQRAHCFRLCRRALSVAVDPRQKQMGIRILAEEANGMCWCWYLA
jgi:hypothetical protein